MRIKVYKADDLKAAMEMVKEELGSDAVILHTKRYKKKSGILGLKSKEVVEVTAAIDDNDTPARPPVVAPDISAGNIRQVIAKTRPVAPADRVPTPQTAGTIDIQSTPQPMNVLTQYKTAGTAEGVEESAQRAARIAGKKPAISRKLTAGPGARRQRQKPVASTPITQPVQYQQPVPQMVQQPATQPKIIRQTVPQPQPVYEEYIEPTAEAPVYEEQQMVADFRPMETTRIIKTAPEVNAAEQEKISALENEVAQLKEMLRKAVGGKEIDKGTVTLREALLAQDIDEQVLEEMIRCMPAGALSLAKDSPEALAAVTQYCKVLLREPGNITLKAGKPRIVALVGTTGVGKTTTLAKIAAKFVLERGAGVALITADTYRISAVEQLKTYSDIIGLPLEIVYSATELRNAIKKFRTKGLILIDTAGRSQHNDFQMQELAELLDVDASIEKHLVLSATTKEKDALDIMDRFAPVKPDRLLFTKTDETESFGTVINLISRRRTPVSYLTNGQSVPDDIEAAVADNLAKLLLK